jgi:hypothetical protein
MTVSLDPKKKDFPEAKPKIKYFGSFALAFFIIELILNIISTNGKRLL